MDRENDFVPNSPCGIFNQGVSLPLYSRIGTAEGKDDYVPPHIGDKSLGLHPIEKTAQPPSKIKKIMLEENDLIPLNSVECEKFKKTISTGTRRIAGIIRDILINKGIPVGDKVHWKITDKNRLILSFCVGKPYAQINEQYDSYVHRHIASNLGNWYRESASNGNVPFVTSNCMQFNLNNIERNISITGNLGMNYISLPLEYVGTDEALMPGEEQYPEAKVKLIAKQNASFGENVFSETVKNGGIKILEKNIGGIVFPSQISGTNLEGNNDSILRTATANALTQFFSKIVNLEGNDRQKIDAICNEIINCEGMEIARHNSMNINQPGVAERFMNFCHGVCGRLLSLKSGEFIVVPAGYSDVGVAHSSYVVYTLSDDGKNFEIYEINAYGLRPIDTGNGIITSMGEESTPANFYKIPKDVLLPVICTNVDGKEIRSSAHIVDMLRMEGENAEFSQQYQQYMVKMWNNYAEYRTQLPAHLVNIFAKSQTSGNCAVRSLECLLMTQFALHFKNAKDACHLARLFSFYMSLQAVEAYCDYYVTNSKEFTVNSWEILKRARTQLIIQSDKLRIMQNKLPNGETCPTVLVAFADKLGKKIDKLLEERQDVTHTVVPPPFPQFDAAIDISGERSKLASAAKKIHSERDASALPNKSKVHRSFMPQPSSILGENKTTENLMKYLEDAENQNICDAVLLRDEFIFSLPPPDDDIWKQMNAEQSRKAYNLLASIVFGVGPTSTASNIYASDIGNTSRFLTVCIMLRLLKRSECFYSAALDKYCVDAHPFKQFALDDCCVITNKIEAEKRESLINFSKKEADSKTPAFMFYDGIGDSEGKNAWPIVGTMKMWQDVFDAAESREAQQSANGNDKKFSEDYKTFTNASKACIASDQDFPSECKTWKPGLQIGSEIFAANEKVVEKATEFANQDDDFRMLWNFSAFCLQYSSRLVTGDNKMRTTWKWDKDKQIFRFFPQSFNSEGNAHEQQEKRKNQHQLGKVTPENKALEQCKADPLSPLEAVPSAQAFVILEHLIQDIGNDDSRQSTSVKDVRRILFKALKKEDGTEMYPALEAARNDAQALINATQQLVNAAFHVFCRLPHRPNLQSFFEYLNLANEIRLVIAEQNGEFLKDESLALTVGANIPLAKFLEEYERSNALGKLKDSIILLEKLKLAQFYDAFFRSNVKQKFNALLQISQNCVFLGKEHMRRVVHIMHLFPPSQDDLGDILCAVNDHLGKKYVENDAKLCENVLSITTDNLEIDLRNGTMLENKMQIFGRHNQQVSLERFLPQMIEIFGLGGVNFSHLTENIISNADGSSELINPIFKNLRFFDDSSIISRTDNKGNELWRYVDAEEAARLVPSGLLVDASAWINKNGELEICDTKTGAPLFRTDQTTGMLCKLTPPFKDCFVKTWKSPDEMTRNDLFSRFDPNGEYYFLAEGKGNVVAATFPRYRDKSGEPLMFSCDAGGKWHYGEYEVQPVPEKANPFGDLNNIIVLRYRPQQSDGHRNPNHTMYIIPKTPFRPGENLRGSAEIDTSVTATNKLLYGRNWKMPMHVLCDCHGREIHAHDVESTLAFARTNLYQKNYAAAMAQLKKINFTRPLSQNSIDQIKNICHYVYWYDSSASASAVALYARWLWMQAEKTIELPGFTNIFSNYLRDIETVPLDLRINYDIELDLLEKNSLDNILAHRLVELKKLSPEDIANNRPRVDRSGRKYTAIGVTPPPASDYSKIQPDEINAMRSALEESGWILDENEAHIPESNNSYAGIFYEIKSHTFENMYTYNGDITKKKTVQDIYEDLRNTPTNRDRIDDTSVAIVEANHIVLAHAITELLSFSGNQLNQKIASLALKVAFIYGSEAPDFPKENSSQNERNAWLANIYNFAKKKTIAGHGPRIPSIVRIATPIQKDAIESDILVKSSEMAHSRLNASYENFQQTKRQNYNSDAWSFIKSLRKSVYAEKSAAQQPHNSAPSEISIGDNSNSVNFAKKQLDIALSHGDQCAKLRRQRIERPIKSLDDGGNACLSQKKDFVAEQTKIKTSLLAKLNANDSNVNQLVKGKLLRPLTENDAQNVAFKYYADASQSSEKQRLKNAAESLMKLNPAIDLAKVPEILKESVMLANECNKIAFVNGILNHIGEIKLARQSGNNTPTENLHRDQMAQEFDNEHRIEGLSVEFCTLFEHISGMRLRSEQLEKLNFCVNLTNKPKDAKDNKGILQLRMGMGKTDVIMMLLLAQVIIGQQKNARLCVDDTQMASVSVQLEERLRAFGIHTFQMPITPTEWLDAENLRRTLNAINRNNARHDTVFLQSAMSMRTMLNMYKSLLGTPDDERLLLLDEIINNEFVEFTDEMQLSYSPHVSFASGTGVGTQQRIPQHMETIIGNMVLHMATEMSAETGICENTQSELFNVETYEKNMRTKLANRVLLQFDFTGAGEPLKDECEKFLLGTTSTFNEDEWNPQFVSSMWLARILLDKYVPDMLQRKYGTDYGFDKNKTRVVPYDRGEMSYGCFRDPIMELSLSCVTAAQIGITQEQMISFINQSMRNAMDERMVNADVEFDKTGAGKIFETVTGCKLSFFSKRSEIFKIKSPEDIAVVSQILMHVNGSPLKTDASAITNRFSIFSLVSKCTFQDEFYETNSAEIPLMAKEMPLLAMSGTPGNAAICPTPMANNLSVDRMAIGGSISTFFNDLHKKDAISFTLQSKTAKDIFSKYLDQLEKSELDMSKGKGIPAGILDMGALLPPNMGQNAMEIFEIISNRTMPFDGVLFWDNARQTFAMVRKSNNGETVIMPVASLLDADLLAAGIHDRRKLFIIYDQAHCTGTNITGLRDDTRMLLLPEPLSMTSDFLAQTLMRLRQYGMGQHIDVAFSGPAITTFRKSTQSDGANDSGATVDEIKNMLITNDAGKNIHMEERCLYERATAITHRFLLNMAAKLCEEARRNVNIIKTSKMEKAREQAQLTIWNINNMLREIQILLRKRETFTDTDTIKKAALGVNPLQDFTDFYTQIRKMTGKFLSKNATILHHTFITNGIDWQAEAYSALEALLSRAKVVLPNASFAGRVPGEMGTVFTQQNAENATQEMQTQQMQQQRLQQQQQMQLIGEHVRDMRQFFNTFNGTLGNEPELQPPQQPRSLTDFMSTVVKTIPISQVFNCKFSTSSADQDYVQYVDNVSNEYQSYGNLFPPSVKATIPFTYTEQGHMIPMFSDAMRKCYFFAQEENGDITFLTQAQAMALRGFIKEGLVTGARVYATAGWTLLEQSKDADGWTIPNFKDSPMRFYVHLFNGNKKEIFREELPLELQQNNIQLPRFNGNTAFSYHNNFIGYNPLGDMASKFLLLRAPVYAQAQDS
ncbi:MAG: hypothetical protein LBT64_00350 [Puniceicoccales bacterium]|nr:hypothetical protein [Puniceicoccales bacterium]